MKIHEIQRCDECGKNFNAKKDLRVHKQEHKKKKKTERNGQEENIDDIIERAEFILESWCRQPRMRDDNIANL